MSKQLIRMDLEEVLRITRGITSGLSRAEAELLYELSREAHRRETGSVVELGAYMGKSTIILAATGLVYSVDHHRGNTEHQPDRPRCRPGTVIGGVVDTFPLFKANVEKAGLWYNVIPVITDHLTALSCLDKLAFPVSLLFVDAEHSYVATTSIIRTWVPRTRGIVLFHDYCAEFPEVVRAVDDAPLGEKTYHVDSIVGFDTKGSWR